MYSENIVTVRDEGFLEKVLSVTIGKNNLLMRNVFAKITRKGISSIIKLNNPVLLVDEVAYIFPNTGTIDEEKLLSRLASVEYNEITYLEHDIDEPFNKDFDIASCEKSTDDAIKSCVQRKAYRKCNYIPAEKIEFELGHYGTNDCPLLKRDGKRVRVSKPEHYILLSIMYFTGTVEFDNELIITTGDVELRNVYRACLNSGVDMEVYDFSCQNKGQAYTKS